MFRRGLWLSLIMGAACAPQDDEAPSADVEAVADVEVSYISDAAWSPRGDRLAVTWEQGGRTRLYGVLGPDTTGSASEPGAGLRLTDGPDGHASWSPDGLWLAFSSRRDGQSEIYRMRPDGTGPERLTDDPAEDTEPSYAPDGRRIAFISTRTDGVPRLHLMDADGGNARMVSNPPGSAHADPEWSPDGARIALQVTTDGGDEVYIATPAGGWGRVKIGTLPAWAPNSDDIYLTRNDSILVARTSSGSLRFVHENGRAPSVSPDGRWLAFVRGHHPTSALYVLDLETREEYRVTR